MATNTPKYSEPIIGKVAGVLNARELFINIGSSKGVRVGMRFKVLTKEPLEVRDPDTGDILGIVDREKVRVKVVEVQESFSICRTYRSKTIGGGLYATGGALADLMGPAKEVPETLQADASSYPPPLSEEESYVKKGDRVAMVTSDDS